MISIFGWMVVIDDPATFYETFNVITISTALVSGFMFGRLAFVPLVRRVAPDGARSSSQAFWLTLAIVVVVFGSVLTVFYVEQIATEVAVRNALSLRAVGRYLAALIFIVAFGAGVAESVRGEVRDALTSADQSPHKEADVDELNDESKNDVDVDDDDLTEVIGDDDDAKGDGAEDAAAEESPEESADESADLPV